MPFARQVSIGRVALIQFPEAEAGKLVVISDVVSPNAVSGPARSAAPLLARHAAPLWGPLPAWGGRHDGRQPWPGRRRAAGSTGDAGAAGGSGGGGGAGPTGRSWLGSAAARPGACMKCRRRRSAAGMETLPLGQLRQPPQQRRGRTSRGRAARTRPRYAGLGCHAAGRQGTCGNHFAAARALPHTPHLVRPAAAALSGVLPPAAARPRLPQALVDFPGQTRRVVSFKRLALTDYTVDIPRLAKKAVLKKALEEAGARLGTEGRRGAGVELMWGHTVWVQCGRVCVS